MPSVKSKENTLTSLLRWGEAFLRERGIDAPRLEAELLFCSVLSVRRIDLYLRSDQAVAPREETLFRERLLRRGAREPIQYIMGEVEFCGAPLFVEPGVFIPRPETELIVELARRLLPAPRRILDLCTGSGALALALAKALPAAEIVATDCSETALKVAQKNAARHGSLHIVFLRGDLFEPLRNEAPFDLIVCNPPYIPQKDQADLQPEVRDYEPPVALFAPEEGTSFYRRILREAPPFLTSRGRILFELGKGQGAWFQTFVREETNFSATLTLDLAGVERIAACERVPTDPTWDCDG
ncbi:MAG TPA: peptide chain release factor N(5)-glutamine methyltransferase [Candidatus Manganitrophaceae bacterium]|nr:peptide chain release factor N(5)-glutamine methyltransferase [Candidatus Manganitrophaceae bacterium]